MIRIGVGKPKIRRTNSWGLVVNQFGYICVDMWAKLLSYQYPPKLLDNSEAGLFIHEQTLRSLVALPGVPNTIWEFSAVSPNQKELIRFVAVFGAGRMDDSDNLLVTWTWFDTHVVHPILTLYTRIYNWIWKGHWIEEALQRIRERSRKIDGKLARGECPGCGGKIERKGVDPRQDGDSLVGGVWVNWRCTSGCGYILDAKETN